jgi:poly-gamma-glutamate synthesis protein (capsule biosynthesis protein)
VVVSLHWGTEYNPEPDPQQEDLAPDLLASPDIDLLIGHHAHVVQPIERVDGEWVVYGLGNQLSNQSEPERRDGLVVVVTVSEVAGRFGVSALQAVPTWVDLAGHRVLAVGPTLADPALDPARRAELSGSLVRTTAAVDGRGAVSDGLVTVG